MTINFLNKTYYNYNEFIEIYNDTHILNTFGISYDQSINQKAELLPYNVEKTFNLNNKIYTLYNEKFIKI